MPLPNIMYVRSHNNKLLIVMICVAIFGGAFSADAQTTTVAQCTNNRLNPGNGSDPNTWGYCAPAACPNGAATCEGTVLCTNGTLNSGPNAGQTCTVAPAASGDLARDGIFGCSASKYQNIGSLSAIGGVYVPVNDAAVTLNTGYLVYKECVLDGVVSAIKNDIVAGLQGQVIRAIETGRGGSPMYVRNIPNELKDRRSAIVVNNLTKGPVNSMCAAFQQPIQNTIARGHLASINDTANTAYLCPLSPNNTGGYSGWFSMIIPTGNIFGATALIAQKIKDDFSEDERNIRQMWDWGNGFYAAFDNNQNPLAANVLTPSRVIAESLQNMLSAGTNILVNASEIDQINGALQAGLQSSLVADTMRGLSGLSRPQNGLPSYVDRMAAEASSAVRSSAVNAALSILSAARQVETLYKNAKEALATALTDAILKLRAAENTCWGLIIPRVQERASSEGVSLTIATSTEFSKKVINENIQPLAETTVRDLRASESALALINQLIASVTNTSSTATQRQALERLDSMVANNQLHTTSEAQSAQKQKDEAGAAVTALVEETLKEWGDSTDTAVGWCNVNNDAVIDMWFDRWKQ